MCVVSLEECTCSCHGALETRHIQACCDACPHCGQQRIKIGFLRSHVKNCAMNPDNKPPETSARHEAAADRILKRYFYS